MQKLADKRTARQFNSEATKVVAQNDMDEKVLRAMAERMNAAGSNIQIVRDASALRFGSHSK